MKIAGSFEYLNDFNYEARVLVDVYVPDLHLWIVPPNLRVQYRNWVLRRVDQDTC